MEKFTKEIALEKVAQDGMYAVIEIAETYKPKYPQRPSRPYLPGRNPSAKEARQFADELEKFEVLEQEYNKEKDAYHTAVNEIDNILIDLFKEETGFYENVPKENQDKVWQKAWEDGHSDGLHEVYVKLGSLVELF